MDLRISIHNVREIWFASLLISVPGFDDADSALIGGSGGIRASVSDAAALLSFPTANPRSNAVI